MKIDGGCHCGFVTWEAELDPEKVVICHCADCQTLSGTAFRTVGIVPRADFRLLSGTPKDYVKTAESGRKRVQAFCPECGSPLYATGAGDDTAFYNIRLGTARQRDQLVPKKQLWCRSAQPWLADMDSAPKAETQ